jgi:hypothetical protein
MNAKSFKNLDFSTNKKTKNIVLSKKRGRRMKAKSFKNLGLSTNKKTENIVLSKKRGRRMNAKSFKITFECNQSYVNSNISHWKYFQNGDVKSITSKGNITIIEISCKSKQTLYSTNKNLKLGRLPPIDVKTNGGKNLNANTICDLFH